MTEAARRVTVGLGLAAVGQLAYLVQQAREGDTALGFASGALSLVAFTIAAAAANARRRGLLRIGFALAALAALSFLPSMMEGPFTLYLAPQVISFVGVSMAAWAARPDGHAFGVRAGAAVAAVGAATWTIVDPENMTSGWLPGEVLTVVGLLMVSASYKVDGATGSGGLHVKPGEG